MNNTNAIRRLEKQIKSAIANGEIEPAQKLIASLREEAYEVQCSNNWLRKADQFEKEITNFEGTTMTLPGAERCTSCGGSGIYDTAEDTVPCPFCKSKGFHFKKNEMGQMAEYVYELESQLERLSDLVHKLLEKEKNSFIWNQ